MRFVGWPRSRFARVLVWTLIIIVTLLLLLALSGLLVLRGNLPVLDGKRGASGLAAEVRINRDDLGVPDIVAKNRHDAALALGYLHAQDRFFQMDLMRRSAAGEMAALVGPALLESDLSVRRHRFRARARAAVEGLSTYDRDLLAAYTAGVNAGLGGLLVRPLEYVFLRQKPAEWQPEDSFLVLCAMYLDLSSSTINYETHLARATHVLPAGLAEMLLPLGNRWEAPLQEGHTGRVILPDSSVFDVRDWTYSGRTYQEFRAYRDSMMRHETTGSNNWAVAGELSAHGGALLANDMHLGLRLPGPWYRARLSWERRREQHSVVGVTLPGAPLLVVGSNGKLAWGFTNSYGDWSDLVILETDPADSNRYRTPDGWREFTRHQETIAVKGQTPETLEVRETIWGPVWGRHPDGRLWALRWTAHDAESLNLNLRLLEMAGTVGEAVSVAGTMGIPQQNMVCADATGSIAWTIAGLIPERVGWDGRLPVSWADGTCRWDGYLHPGHQPRIVNPDEGRLWTANSRVAAGPDLATIGDGGYGLGARARQIRDHLRSLDRPDEKDMLALQLDDRAVFLGEWRELLLPVLERFRADSDPVVEAFSKQVRDHWEGRAATGSVSYCLVRDFMNEAIEGIYGFLGHQLSAAFPAARLYNYPYRHAVAWAVLTERPDNLLSPRFDDWDHFIRETIHTVMLKYEDGTLALEDDTWGRRNILDMTHPFARFVPSLADRLSAPAQALPGDGFMPRVQRPGHGASQRLVVSPGREEQGILHMPGGQSGHPLSRYFLAGHQDWVEGKATPLLPGAPQHSLLLRPSR
jgi:penicillin amidase